MNDHIRNWRVKKFLPLWEKVKCKEMKLGGHFDYKHSTIKHSTQYSGTVHCYHFYGGCNIVYFKSNEIVFMSKLKIRWSHEIELWNDSWVTWMSESILKTDLNLTDSTWIDLNGNDHDRHMACNYRPAKTRKSQKATWLNHRLFLRFIFESS